MVQEHIAAGELRVPIIFMTAHGDIAMSVKAMKAGAMADRRGNEPQRDHREDSPRAGNEENGIALAGGFRPQGRGAGYSVAEGGDATARFAQLNHPWLAEMTAPESGFDRS